MKINFEQMQKEAAKNAAMTAGRTEGYMPAGGFPVTGQKGAAPVSQAGSPAGFSVDFSGKAAAPGSYGRQKEETESIADKAASQDPAAMNKYMVVMSHTMSGEDYRKLTEEGVHPGKIEASDSVTIMDHIKTVMARSGTVVEGFNGQGDLDMDMLRQITGSETFAKELANAYREKDLPITEDTVRDVAAQMEKLSSVHGLTDGMKQYLLENNLDPTIDNIYLAQYSAGNAAVKGGGYFAEGLGGYIGKTAEGLSADEMQMLSGRISEITSEAGLLENDTTRRECEFLLDADIPLTPENLLALSRLDEIEIPIDDKTAIGYMTDAIAEGKGAGAADLGGRSLLAEAEKLLEQTAQISEQAVENVIAEGKTFTIRSLSMTQRQIDLAMTQGFSNSSVAAAAGTSEAVMTQIGMANGEAAAFAASVDTMEAAKLTLTQVQLRMTVSANMALLSSGYSIDTTPLEQLVDDLKAVETAGRQTWGLQAQSVEGQALFSETMAEREALFDMPAALLGRIVDSSQELSLRHIGEVGRNLQETYRQAGESYEALMTAPRADLGDSIKNAFRNVEEILSMNDMLPTEDNRKAVRILSYNHMDVTPDNIASVRLADQTLTSVLKKMNPAATLQMIRDGINPLEQSLEELSAYFDEQELSLPVRSEKYSRFLYEMEQSGDITQDERESYMGIYRLITQIEKGDSKAVGSLVGSGRELTFANLLSAVRTSQKGGISAEIGDDFGGVVSQIDKSISDQIDTYFRKKAMDLSGSVTPQLFKQSAITMQSSMEELILADDELRAQMGDMGSTAAPLPGSLEAEFEELQQALNSPQEITQLLMETGQAVNGDNQQALADMIGDRGGYVKKIQRLLSGNPAQAGAPAPAMAAPSFDRQQAVNEWNRLMFLPLSQFTEEASAQDAYAQFTSGAQRLLDESMYGPQNGYIDVRQIHLAGKQLALANKMSKRECYELPAVIDGQLTSVQVRFVKSKAQKATSRVNVEVPGQGTIRSEFRLEASSLKGLVACESREMSDKLKQKITDFSEKFLSETGLSADINIVYSDGDLRSYLAGETVDGDARETAKQLYTASKLFIEGLADLGA
ncbi:MAG: hypothetical protein IK078_00885 [Lachnospiraceae bacterium]|nr:hypothetical protein [Lachnospiraceae bacterium]